MNCMHSLIIGETKNHFPCFICLTCFKAQPLMPLKDPSKFCCNSSTWRFNKEYKYIYCDICKKIIKD